MSTCDGGGTMIFQRKVELPEPIARGNVTGAVNQQQGMNSLEMEKLRKVQRKKKWKVARPNDVVGARMIYKKMMKDCDVDEYRCRLTA